MIRQQFSRKTGTPTVINQQEVNNLKSWIKDKVDDYLSKGHLSFTCKDLFGGYNWNWSNKKFPISILYYRWYQRYEQKYPEKPVRDIQFMAYDAAGQSVGLLLKQVCEESNSYEFDYIEEFCSVRYRLTRRIA